LWRKSGGKKRKKHFEKGTAQSAEDGQMFHVEQSKTEPPEEPQSEVRKGENVKKRS
jgi:hypothetical protein